jgi:flagellar motor switch protein FliN/FliY
MSEKHSSDLPFLDDVELEISVVLGAKQLPLKDILHFKTGSVVELDNVVTEPVEIVANGIVIAKGELVEVENNFGVKITQVLPQAKKVIDQYGKKN